MNVKKILSELCTPASIYLVISLGSIIIALFYGFAFSAVAMQVIFVFAWTFLLNFLCRKGMKMVSWFLVLFPYLITLGTWSMLTFKEGFGIKVLGFNFNGPGDNIKRQQQDLAREQARNIEKLFRPSGLPAGPAPGAPKVNPRDIVTAPGQGDINKDIAAGRVAIVPRGYPLPP